MRDDKKAEILRSLENFQQQLEDLKKENPDGDYEQLERMIDYLNRMLNGEQNQTYFFKYFLKKALFIILCYILYTISTGAVLGFSYPFLSLTNPLRLLYIIPIVSAILFVSHRLIDLLLNTLKRRHLLLHFVFLNLVLILILSFLDAICFKVCSSVIQAFILLFITTIFASIWEFYLTKKLLLF